MLTTYDEIYLEFINICETDDINLPDTDERKYNAIHSAIRHFNSRLGLNIKFDDTTENIDKLLDDSHLILMAHYLRLSFLENQLIHLTTIYSPFQKDIGIKNYQEQSRNLKELVDRESKKIEDIITQNYIDDYM